MGRFDRRVFLSSLASLGALAGLQGAEAMPLVRAGAAAGGPRRYRSASAATMKIVNNTNLYAKDEIYVANVGQNASSVWQHQLPDGTMQDCSPSDNDGPSGYADYSFQLSALKNNSIAFPYLSGRVWFSIGAPLKFLVQANSSDQVTGITQPSGWAPSDPNYDTLFDWIEYTYFGSANVNTTMVDMFGIPLEIQVASTSGTQSAGQLVKHGRTKIFSQIAGMKDFSNLIVGTKNMPDLRVIAPGHGIENNVFPSTYLDDAILAAWQHFTSHNLTVTTGYGTATGRVQGSSASPMIFTRNGGTVATIDLPTTLQTFECSGPLAQGNNEAGAIGDVLAAALNRSLLPKYVNQPYCEKGKFYQASATNSYSKTMHANTKDYNCYGFAFDDQCGYSSDIGAADMTELTVTLQSFT